ncbi:hypothetical protein A8F94_17440 [Bacillus sp. FJAT-27225]|uniref:hypothetical protein n=1 Tax=Bacillus sp. FJAT-27225 TaxID=1743144 RepID=UPI00080C2427|nr:hypothetical protein [Bacillus sp. FJAT-27225]OCA84480.1 hypothetical protein A8F94_17440 [Bacillus sp. FJAT-27225]
MYKIWLNTDAEGNIIETYGGFVEFVLPPDKEYDYFFEVDGKTFKDIGNYQVIDGDLVYSPKEPEDTEPPLPPTTLESLAEENKELKSRLELAEKENQMNAFAIMELAEIILGGGM